jgi:prephenate dehydratase
VSTGYLGPAGTFAHQALLALDPSVDALPLPSTPAALAAVRAGEVAAALVPFENSVEGSVAATLDGLADLSAAPLSVRAEVLLPVHFALLGRPGTTLAAVRTVATHPHAEAQCRGWLAAHLPGVEVSSSASTSTAARDVAAGTYDAAVSSPLAAQVHGLAVVADDVADAGGGVTRFVLVAPRAAAPAPTGADRTTLVLFEREDAPGSLLEMLTEFAARGVNLTRLESRPTGEGLGSYCFHLDADGHLAEARVGQVLTALRRICAEVRVLGSYPRADNTPTRPLRAGNADGDYVAAEAWLAGLREHG